MMYEELVKTLKKTSMNFGESDTISVLLLEAANAIEEKQCPHYIRNVHDRGDDSLCDKWVCEVKSLPKWIPVTERLPEEKDRYLTVSIEPWFGTTVVDTMRWSGVWMYDGRQTEATVTHWMPLPEPPKEEI